VEGPPWLPTSRTVIRALVVSAVLLFALQWRLTDGVRTAYSAGWKAHPDSAYRLPDAGWVVSHSIGIVGSIAALLAALWLWGRRRRKELAAQNLQPDPGHAALGAWHLIFGIGALVASAAAMVCAILADTGNHHGLVAAASGGELAALVLVGATTVIVAATTRASGVTPTAVRSVLWVRAFLQRQRIALILVGFLALIQLFVGQTSGQAVDSIRVWTEFGDDKSLARLSFGIASILLLSLVIYEGGLVLARTATPAAADRASVRARWWFVAGASVAVTWAILYFSLHRSLGLGLLWCAAILVLLGLLEIGHADLPTQPAGATPDMAGHEGAVETLAITPLLIFAIVAVWAAVDAGLAGAGFWECLRVFSPGAALGALAVLLTRESPYVAGKKPWWIWVLGGGLFALSIGLLIVFRVEDWHISSVVGFALCVFAVLYAVGVFRVAKLPLLGAVGGWRLSIPVGLATGLTTFFLLHYQPEGFGETIGSFALLALALAFILAWFPSIIAWSIRRRPPRTLWALGIQQLPVITLVLLAWILAGVIKPPSTLHDVRWQNHPALTARPTLTKVFQTWTSDQPELVKDAAGPPVPLMLVAAHGGGIKAAYWTALVLDCVVGVDPTGFDPAKAQPGDESTCTSHRRSAAAQRRAADHIFLISAVSGGSIGMFAYSRQLLADGSLGQATDDSQDSWVNRRLARDFVSPTIGWTLFHDLPNHILGLHPRNRGVCAWHFFGTCATEDRGTVLEQTFDDAFSADNVANPTLRGTWEARGTSARARAVPLLVGNATATGGKARVLISAADLSAWPNLEGPAPAGPDPRPLAGIGEVSDTLCATNDLLLSTATLLAGHFPYVNASAHLEANCGATSSSTVPAADKKSNCVKITDRGICELNLVDGGYAENSGLFTIASLWPALHDLVARYNAGHTRKVALTIVELDNHYRPRARDVARGSGGKSETLIPPLTAFGAHNAAETYARSTAHRLTGNGCTLTISPRLHPGLKAPLGWELSLGARDDLRRGLVEPRPDVKAPIDPTKSDPRLTPVLDLRRIQAWLGGEQIPNLGTDLKSCVPS
jgi:hypothetical protein